MCSASQVRTATCSATEQTKCIDCTAGEYADKTYDPWASEQVQRCVACPAGKWDADWEEKAIISADGVAESAGSEYSFAPIPGRAVPRRARTPVFAV